MNIGFTGTQIGLTAAQGRTLFSILQGLRDDLGYREFHHGDCIGADEQAHHIARNLGLKIVIHPPLYGKKRAYCKGDFCHEPMEYLERNQEIVNESNILVATPKEDTEQLRSGTWSTVRRAKKKGIHVIIIKPNGEMEIWK